jgi:TPR repeat protein
MTKLDQSLDEQLDVANALLKRGLFHEAIEKYRVLAESGSVESQLRVGWMFHTGQGVKIDLDEARRWYLRAANSSNSPTVQFYLGTLNRDAHLYAEAMEYFERAASENYLPAIYQLGRMYESGEGVSADKDKAYKYYEHASAIGHLVARRDMAVMIIKGHLGLKQIPRGIFQLVRSLYDAIVLHWRDPDSDLIRW